MCMYCMYVLYILCISCAYHAYVVHIACIFAANFVGRNIQTLYIQYIQIHSITYTALKYIHHGPRELRVDACTSRHRRPRDPLGTSGRERAGGAARLGAGAARRRMHISAPPAARPGAFGDRWPRAGRSSCATRSGPTRRRLRMRIILNELLFVAIRILPFELWPRALKQTARKLVGLVTNQIVSESR
jgi:hypothetical protein